MDPDFDISLDPSADGTSEEAKGHFLDSLGLGERTLLADSANVRTESHDEGVVLSSMPDDLGFPTSGPAANRALSFSYSITVQKDRKTDEEVSAPVDEGIVEVANVEPDIEEQAESVEEEAGATNSLDETLYLQCPECRGSLVLSRRHLGIEGACVWCHTPIVAAESARDGQVRIFPILGHASATPAVDERPAIETSVPSESSHDLVGRESEETAPSAPDFSFEPTTALSEVAEIAPEATTEKEMAGNLPDFGISPIPDVAEEVPLVTGFVEEPLALTAPDLDSLYDTGGFLAAQGIPALTLDLGDTAVKPNASAEPQGLETEVSIPGFGAFLQAPRANSDDEANRDAALIADEISSVPAGEFSTPTPWGPPVPVANAPTETGDAAPKAVPVGFASSFGSPLALTPAKADPTPTAPTWEAAFGPSPLDSAPAMAMAAFPPTDEEAGLKGMGDGFPESPSPMAMPAPSFGSASEPVPQIGNGFSVGSSPTSNGFDAPKVSEESRTFAPPFHAFATGSSVDSESGTSKNLFGDPTPAASLWDSDLTSNDDGAPTLLSPMGEVAAAIPAASLFGAENSGSASLFADIGTGGTASAFTGFEEDDSDKAPMESPVPAMTASPVAPPALPAMATSPDMERQDAAGTPTFTAMPQVTSQTLGAKPKPTVRKGFIVLMVVIVGFASGAALASFVLPVEEYVSAARSFMESKFSSGVAVPRMPALPALPAEMNVSNPSSVSATTTDPQP